MGIQKIVAMLVAACVIFTACGKESDSMGNEMAVAVSAKGRYVEEKTNFPDFTTVVALEQVTANTFYALGTKNGYHPPFEVVCSTDGGATWEARGYKGIGELLIAKATFTPQGGLYAMVVTNPEDEENAQFSTVYIDRDGVRPVENVEGLQAFNFGFALTAAGEMLINNGFSLSQVNLKTGRESHRYTFEEQIGDNPCIYDSILAVSQEKEIVLFDMETGEKAGSVPYATGGGTHWAVAVQPDRSGFFYCNESGLYRVSMDGAITEQFIDGAIASFGSPTVYVDRLFACADGSFLMLCSGGKVQLQRYVFDADMAREPQRELTIFTLREDKYVQQLARLYQSENPDVMLTTYVGVSDGGSETVADAMRTLSTELLAGNGPDLLVLDGLPFDSYQSHGALADLSQGMGDKLDGLLPNVSADFVGEEAVYALPTRISVPVVAGTGIENIHSINDLVRYVVSLGEKGIGVEPHSLMTEFYPMCAARWFSPEGGLNPHAVTEDLTALRQLQVHLEALPHMGGDMSANAMYWSYNLLALIQAPFRQMEDAAPIFSAFHRLGEGELRLFPDADGGIYLPGSILGVNAASGNLESAKDFVSFAFGKEAQSSTLANGVAVTLEGLEATAHRVAPGTVIAVGASGNRSTGDFYESVDHWPDNGEMQQVMELLQSAKIPVLVNETIREMVLTETGKFFQGDRTVEQTVQSLSRVVERYTQESS